MANIQRGEASIEGPEGKTYTLCLTLGAIAQLEERLQIDSLSNIDQLLKKGRMRDLLMIFVCLLQGGGHSEIKEVSDLMNWQVRPKTLATKITEAFAAAGFGDDDEEDASEK
jgi:hypothetical protein